MLILTEFIIIQFFKILLMIPESFGYLVFVFYPIFLKQNLLIFLITTIIGELSVCVLSFINCGL